MTISHHAAQSLLGSYNKVIQDMSFFSFQLFCFSFLFFFVVPFFERQNSYQAYAFFLPKISRTNFYYQIVLGLLLIPLLACILFYILTLVTLWYLTQSWYCNLFFGFLSIAYENSILICATLFFSLLLSQTIAYFTAIAFYVLCYTSHDWYKILEKKEGLVYLLPKLIYYCIPDLALLDCKSNIICTTPLQNTKVIFSSLYALLFSMLFLVMGHKIFCKKYW